MLHAIYVEGMSMMATCIFNVLANNASWLQSRLQKMWTLKVRLYYHLSGIAADGD